MRPQLFIKALAPVFFRFIQLFELAAGALDAAADLLDIFRQGQILRAVSTDLAHGFPNDSPGCVGRVFQVSLSGYLFLADLLFGLGDAEEVGPKLQLGSVGFGSEYLPTHEIQPRYISRRCPTRKITMASSSISNIMR